MKKCSGTKMRQMLKAALADIKDAAASFKNSAKNVEESSKKPRAHV
jgi:hypothetical protein